MNGGNETDKMKKMSTVGGVGEYEEEEVRKEQIRRLIELQTFAGELGDIPSKYARPYMYVYVVASVFVLVRFCCNLSLVITLLPKALCSDRSGYGKNQSPRNRNNDTSNRTILRLIDRQQLP